MTSRAAGSRQPGIGYPVRGPVPATARGRAQMPEDRGRMPVEGIPVCRTRNTGGAMLRAFLLKHFAEDLAQPPREKEEPVRDPRRNSGVALFMVLAAVSVLSVLATEFTYIAQVNQKMAFDSLDQLKAHYLAKSGMKISLLRLKAYAQVKALIGSMSGGGAGAPAGGGAMSAVPKQLLEQIWSFPFMFPIPTSLPGMSITDKEAIDDFTKNTGLEGQFSAKISSESAKYNLNRILAPFAAEPSASPGPSGAPSTNPNPSPSAGASPNVPTANQPSGGPSAAASFSPDAARKTLNDFLAQILQNKFDTDEDFQSEYRDFRMDDLMDGIVSWADRTYQRRLTPDENVWPAIKQAPFNTVSELHMVSPMNDDIYDLFATSLTVATTPGIDIDTMEETTLRALVPLMTPEEVQKFFTYRDSLDEDNLFKTRGRFLQVPLEQRGVLPRKPVDDRSVQERFGRRKVSRWLRTRPSSGSRFRRRSISRYACSRPG